MPLRRHTAVFKVHFKVDVSQSWTVGANVLGGFLQTPSVIATQRRGTDRWYDVSLATPIDFRGLMVLQIAVFKTRSVTSARKAAMSQCQSFSVRFPCSLKSDRMTHLLRSDSRSSLSWKPKQDSYFDSSNSCDRKRICRSLDPPTLTTVHSSLSYRSRYVSISIITAVSAADAHEEERRRSRCIHATREQPFSYGRQHTDLRSPTERLLAVSAILACLSSPPIFKSRIHN
jgi:hypothetical protein